MISWQQLVCLSDNELAHKDVAETHFACAAGLPGADRIDIPAYLRTLDQYAWQVRKTTDRLGRVFEQQPGKFNHSRAYFRLLVMTTVFQRDLGIRSTDKLNRDDFDFSDSRDIFLHGLLEGSPGSCASLPVLYAAVGRRLNYPMRLATRPSHLFARWDEPDGERLNLECTANGFFSPSDEYYLRWRTPVSPGELFNTYFLKSLTPREELSGFLISRAYCLLHNGRHREAIEAACHSHELAPHHHLHLETVRRLLLQWRAKLERLMPPPRPALTIHPAGQRFPKVPFTVEEESIYLGILDALLRDPKIQSAYRQPIQRSPSTGLPVGVPERIVVRCDSARAVPVLASS